MRGGSGQGGSATSGRHGVAPRWWRALLPLYAVAALVITLDQASKAWVVGLLGTTPGPERRLLGEILYLRLVHNSGAAFGMLRDASVLFAVAAVAVSAGIVFYSRRLAAASLLVRLALGLELGGALGNLIDRLRWGYVVDFVDVRLWPYVFNVADAAITVGVVLLLAHVLLEGREQHPAPAKHGQTSGDRSA